ncbi:MAG: DUF3275 family protein [Burkholderiales bacterium]
MSLQIPGKLIVQVRNGSRGAFSVGDLITSVGSFKVKDQFLDQFAEGIYEGEFTVASIYPSCYTYRGSITTEIRAKVVDYILATAEEVAVAPDAEPDPIDQQGGSSAYEEAAKSEAAPAQKRKESKSNEANATAGKNVAADKPMLADLFDAEIIAAITSGSPVKLDPTIDRQKFRAQRDYLKNVCKPAYEFKSLEQTWYVEGTQP